MIRRLLPDGRGPEYRTPSGTVVLAEVPVHLGLGRAADRRRSSRPPAAGSPTSPGSARASLPGADTVYQEGDLVHLMLREDDVAASPRRSWPAPPAGEH